MVRIRIRVRVTLGLIDKIKYLTYQDILGPILIQLVAFYKSFLNS